MGVIFCHSCHFQGAACVFKGRCNHNRPAYWSRRIPTIGDLNHWVAIMPIVAQVLTAPHSVMALGSDPYEMPDYSPLPRVFRLL